MSKKKKIIIWIIIIAVIAGTVFYFASREPKVNYTVEEIRRSNLIQTVSATGEVVSIEEADISFKTAGIVNKIYFNVGDEIKKGDKIAEIDKGSLCSQLQGAREYVKVQRNTLYDYKKRDETYNDYQREAQRATIRRAEKSVQEILDALKYTSIYSPIDGILTDKNLEAGEVALAGTTVVSVKNPQIEIESNVPESDILKLHLGQKAIITLDALGQGEELEAEISKIDPAATVIQDVVYYKVEFKLSNPDSRLKYGMSCDIDVLTAEKKSVISIPERVIISEDGKKTVEIFLSENETKKVEVQTGLEGDEGMIEVVSGLKEGDKIVVFSKEEK